MRNFIYFILVMLVMWHFVHRDHLDMGWKWEGWPTAHPLAPKDPVQVAVAPGTVPLWRVGGFTFTPLATYAITARILDASAYSHDAWSDVCPLDLALGWGPMSDPTIYEQYDITQYDRHYIWRYSGDAPISEDEVNTHSANTHVLPANDSVRDILFTFQRHDVVRLAGYLVHIDLPDGSGITSSLVRTDVGDGACEVLWVTKAEKIGR
jgi:hypothetical protein